MIAALLEGLGLRALWIGAAALAVLAVLAGARASGQAAERAAAARRSLDARKEMDHAAADYRGDGAARRLRDGRF